MNNNCLLDIENKIKIPQNEKDYFIIKKSEDWFNSIDIEFNSKNNLNIINLFIIVKSFIKNVEFFCFKITTIVVKKEVKNIIITENLLMNQFINMSYWDFEYWISNKILEDKKYIEKDEDLYAIRVSFQKKIIEGLNKKYNIDVLSFLKPKFPWEENVYKSLSIKKNIDDDTLELNEIIKKMSKDEKKKIIKYLKENNIK